MQVSFMVDSLPSLAWPPRGRVAGLSGARMEGSASQPVSTGRAARRAGRVRKAQLAPQPAKRFTHGKAKCTMERPNSACMQDLHACHACSPGCGSSPVSQFVTTPSSPAPAPFPLPTCVLQQPGDVAAVVCGVSKVGGHCAEAVVACRQQGWGWRAGDRGSMLSELGARRGSAGTTQFSMQSCGPTCCLNQVAGIAAHPPSMMMSGCSPAWRASPLSAAACASWAASCGALCLRWPAPAAERSPLTRAGMSGTRVRCERNVVCET